MTEYVRVRLLPSDSETSPKNRDNEAERLYAYGTRIRS